MKSLTLRIDDTTLSETSKILAELKKARNKYIIEALNYYNKKQKADLLAKELERESILVSDESLKVLHEFESLEDEY